MNDKESLDALQDELKNLIEKYADTIDAHIIGFNLIVCSSWLIFKTTPSIKEAKKIINDAVEGGKKIFKED